jgi:hypothetical protein
LALRSSGAGDLADVDAVVLETDGSMSVLKSTIRVGSLLMNPSTQDTRTASQVMANWRKTRSAMASTPSASFDSWSGLGRVLLVGPLAYVALVAILRISGKRTLTKLNAFDLVVTVAPLSVRIRRAGLVACSYPRFRKRSVTASSGRRAKRGLPMHCVR